MGFDHLIKKVLAIQSVLSKQSMKYYTLSMESYVSNFKTLNSSDITVSS